MPNPSPHKALRAELDAMVSADSIARGDGPNPPRTSQAWDDVIEVVALDLLSQLKASHAETVALRARVQELQSAIEKADRLIGRDQWEGKEILRAAILGEKEKG